MSVNSITAKARGSGSYSARCACGGGAAAFARGLFFFADLSQGVYSVLFTGLPRYFKLPVCCEAVSLCGCGKLT